MAEDDPELWSAIHRLTCVLEGLDHNDAMHVDGLFDKAKDLFNAVKKATGLAKPQLEYKPPADSLKSEKSETWSNITYLKEFYGNEIKAAIDTKIKTPKISTEQLKDWKTALTKVNSLLENLNVQEKALKVLSENQQLCDFHADDVLHLRKSLLGSVGMLGKKEDPTRNLQSLDNVLTE